MKAITSTVERLMPGILIAVLMLAAGLIPGARTAGQAAQSWPDVEAIDAYVEMQMRELRIPGLALGIVQGDQVVYAQGYGAADPAGRHVTPQTPFILNSISKSFAALAVMQLVEGGRIELNAPVQEYLPWFRVADAAASAQITVRHLLNQTSGLPESASYDDLTTPASNDFSLEERVHRLHDTQLSHPVGASFEYTDANYDVLGLVVQSVAGQPYAEYVEQHILAPLAMSRSGSTRPTALPDDLAVGHRSWFGVPVPFTKWYSHAMLPSGDLISTADDMTHYLIAQLNEGRYNGSAVLSPAGIATLHEPAVREGDSEKFYGMGWETRPMGDLSVVRHSGTSANYYADVVLVPEGRWGVALLLNMNSLNLYGGRIQALSGGIVSILRGETPPTLPAMHHPLLFPAMIAILVVTGVLSAWMVWMVVVWGGRQAMPGRSASGWRRAVAVCLPFALTLGWALVLLLGVPQILYPLSLLRINLPDFGYSVLVSIGLAVGWTVVWGVAVYRMMRSGKRAVLPVSVPEAMRA